ncbi:hypothetical protein GJV44_00253 [Candidatus Vallotia cooleyia]|nr:hypothetical protein GJV44_00253 [Candidatus Vallotia cooleyia]
MILQWYHVVDSSHQSLDVENISQARKELFTGLENTVILLN